MALSARWMGACLVSVAAVAAQDQGQSDVDVKSRVSRVLKALREAPSYQCRTQVKAKSSPIMRQIGGRKTSTKTLTTVKEGDLLCWSKSEDDEILARHGGRWILLDRDGDWIPCRKPEGPAWRSEFLPDPTFLANRLMHLLPKTEWKAAGSETLGEKAVRVYRCKLDLDEANHLIRTGALPEGGGIMGAVGRAIMVVGGPGGAGMPEPEREVEILLYEDPASRMPLKIVARTFQEDSGMGAMRIAIGGIGGQENEEEEEEEEKKKKKPAYTMTCELSKIGQAKASLLSKKARQILGK